jgi:heat shock protein 90kDa beta
MAKKLVRKVLEMLRKLATGEHDDIGGVDKDAAEGSESVHPYITFWEQYSKSIKMGVIEDQANRSKLAKLLRFKTLKSESKYISLDDYVKDFKEWQKDIYYVAGESEEILEKSPFVEAAKKKGVDVLFLTDPLDEYCVQHLADYEGHRMQSLTKEGLKFGDEDEDELKKKAKKYRETFKPVIKFMKDLYGSRVSKVSVSQRIDSSPAVVVTSQFGNTANMERIAKTQTLNSKESYKSMQATKTMEINPRHPIIIELNKLATDAPEAQSTKDLANLLLDTALQTSGFDLEDHMDSYADRVYRTMASTLQLKSMALAEDIAVEEEEEEEEKSDSSSSSHDEF